MPVLRYPPVTTLASETIHVKKQEPPRVNGILWENREHRGVSDGLLAGDFLTGLTVWSTNCRKDMDQIVIPLLHHLHWPDWDGNISCARRGEAEGVAYVVASLLIFITLLVGLGLGLIWFALLRVECLPPLAEDLANLA